jgi:hypothetical protein
VSDEVECQLCGMFVLDTKEDVEKHSVQHYEISSNATSRYNIPSTDVIKYERVVRDD